MSGGGHRLRVTAEQREKILKLYLHNRKAGTLLAMKLGLSPAYAYRLAHSRGLMPRVRKEWGKYQEAKLME